MSLPPRLLEECEVGLHDATLRSLALGLDTGCLDLVIKGAYVGPAERQTWVGLTLQGIGEFSAFEVEAPDYIIDGVFSLRGAVVPILLDDARPTGAVVDQGYISVAPSGVVAFRPVPGANAMLSARELPAQNPGSTKPAVPPTASSIPPEAWRGGEIASLSVDFSSRELHVRIVRAALPAKEGQPARPLEELVLTSADVTSFTAFRLIPPARLSPFGGVLGRAVRSGEGAELREYDIILPGGVVRWVASSLVAYVWSVPGAPAPM